MENKVEIKIGNKYRYEKEVFEVIKITQGNPTAIVIKSNTRQIATTEEWLDTYAQRL